MLLLSDVGDYKATSIYEDLPEVFLVNIMQELG
jgi:hypothetical protein